MEFFNKTIINLFFASILLVPSISSAKVTFDGKPVEKLHADTVKGLLYDVLKENNDKKSEYGPKFAKAVIWLENAIKNNEKVFELSKIETENSRVIKSGIVMITKFIKHSGYSDQVIDSQLEEWVSTGRKLLIEYIKNNKYVKWKYELPKK